jgi:uncharacterized membrane protein YphA (DoxX/SURF4 family)
LTAVLFGVPGAALLAKVPHFVDEMARLGYPAYFLTIMGVFKIAGAIVILAPRLPRLKEWAYAGMIIDAACAALSHAAIGDPPFTMVLPMAIGALAFASWWLRPDNRKLVNFSVAAT